MESIGIRDSTHFDLTFPLWTIQHIEPLLFQGFTGFTP